MSGAIENETGKAKETKIKKRKKTKQKRLGERGDEWFKSGYGNDFSTIMMMIACFGGFSARVCLFLHSCLLFYAV